MLLTLALILALTPLWLRLERAAARRAYGTRHLTRNAAGVLIPQQRTR